MMRRRATVILALAGAACIGWWLADVLPPLLSIGAALLVLGYALRPEEPKEEWDFGSSSRMSHPERRP